MAKNVIINGVTYQNVPYVEVPLANSSGNARFVDTTIETNAADASMILKDKQAYVGGNLVTGTVTVPTISQDNSTKVLTIQ